MIKQSFIEGFAMGAGFVGGILPIIITAVALGVLYCLFDYFIGGGNFD